MKPAPTSNSQDTSGTSTPHQRLLVTQVFKILIHSKQRGATLGSCAPHRPHGKLPDGQLQAELAELLIVAQEGYWCQGSAKGFLTTMHGTQLRLATTYFNEEYLIFATCNPLPCPRFSRLTPGTPASMN